jgi:hypothetical protein
VPSLLRRMRHRDRQAGKKPATRAASASAALEEPLNNISNAFGARLRSPLDSRAPPGGSDPPHKGALAAEPSVILLSAPTSPVDRLRDNGRADRSPSEDPTPVVCPQLLDEDLF